MLKQTFLEKNEIIKEIANLGIDIQIANLLYQRGFTSVQLAKEFLYPHENMLSPADILNMDEAVKKIKNSICKGETILIYGDYDCDGICSVAMLKLYLESMGANVVYYIPTREEGYGLSIDTLEKVMEMFLPDLIITVDCGITAFEEVLYCYEVLGVDIIITDHHEPFDEIPDCIVINPKLQKDSPLKNLCGAGVVLKLIEALGGREKSLEYIDLACIATIADVVPLTGENRLIASLGLEKLNRRERQGLKMLASNIGIERITAADIGYKIAPRLNAPGRMGCKNDIVPLFCSKEYFEIESIVKELERENEKRQLESNAIYNKTLDKLKKLRLEEISVIVLHDADWDYGLLGLVAAKLASEFCRPAIILNSKTEYCRGSARSVEGINIYECLKAAEKYLEQYGGHEGAAGLTVNIAKLDNFTSYINEYVKHNFSTVLDNQITRHDMKIDSPSMISTDFYKQLELLEPTGAGNCAPLFSVNSSRVKISSIGNTKHAKVKLNKDCEGVIFNAPHVLSGYQAGAEYQFITSFNQRRYKNYDYINMLFHQIKVKSVKDIVNTPNSFLLYLCTALYGSSQLNAQFISFDGAVEQARDKNTIVLAFSAESGKRFLEDYKNTVELAVGDSSKNPLNRLLFFPEIKDFSYYRKAIFLDAPLSTAYISSLQERAPETEILIAKQYGYKEIFKNIDISNDSILVTQSALFNYLNINPDETSLEKIYKKLVDYCYLYDEFSFVAHFVALLDYGIITHKNERFSTNNYKFEIEKSRVINTINKLRDIK